MKRNHVFIYVEEEGERKFRGFFIDRPTAEVWVKKQENPDAYEISDEPPVKKVVDIEDGVVPPEAFIRPERGPTQEEADAARVNEGMAKALTAVKEAKDA